MDEKNKKEYILRKEKVPFKNNRGRNDMNIDDESQIQKPGVDFLIQFKQIRELPEDACLYVYELFPLLEKLLSVHNRRSAWAIVIGLMFGSITFVLASVSQECIKQIARFSPFAPAGFVVGWFAVACGIGLFLGRMPYRQHLNLLSSDLNNLYTRTQHREEVDEFIEALDVIAYCQPHLVRCIPRDIKRDVAMRRLRD